MTTDRPPIVAINPGTFDPVTLGHVDVIRRAAAIFDRVVVGVVRDPHHKQTTFTVEERVAFLEDALSELDNVVVDVFSELVVDFARKHGARTMVKGLRVIADFEWEFQMNRLNHRLAPEVETMYVMSSPEFAFVSSSGVKEIASFGGNVEGLVTPAVAKRFRELYPNGRPGAPVSSPRGLLVPRGNATVARSRLAGQPVRRGDPETRGCQYHPHGRPRTHRQARRSRAQRQGGAAHRPGPHRPRGDLRHPRPDGATIPEEIKQARWIVKERQEMLAEAKRECDRLIGEAREQAVREASQTEIVKLAERQAQDIVEEARRSARETRLEMEDWADGILSTLEVNLDKFLGAVRRGRERLHERSQETVVAGIGPVDRDGAPDVESYQ